MGITLREKFGSVIGDIMKLSRAAAKIDETKVYEEANLGTRKYMFGRNFFKRFATWKY